MSLKYLILFHVVDIMLTTFDFYKNFLWCSNLQRGSRRTSTGFLCRGEHPIKQKFVLKKLVAYGGGGEVGAEESKSFIGVCTSHPQVSACHLSGTIFMRSVTLLVMKEEFYFTWGLNQDSVCQ